MIQEGFLGIDFVRDRNKTFVFLYLTETSSPDDGDGEALENRLYRYELDDDSDNLYNPKLLLNLLAGPGSTDNC